MQSVDLAQRGDYRITAIILPPRGWHGPISIGMTDTTQCDVRSGPCRRPGQVVDYLVVLPRAAHTAGASCGANGCHPSLIWLAPPNHRAGHCPDQQHHSNNGDHDRYRQTAIPDQHVNAFPVRAADCGNCPLWSLGATPPAATGTAAPPGAKCADLCQLSFETVTAVHSRWH